MMYLDPKADLTFKKIFAKHPDLLISLLNSLLPLSDEEQIVEIKYLPNELVPELYGRKNTIVDVLCQDVSGCLFCVVLLLVWCFVFLLRVLFNASKLYVTQLQKAEEYETLKPVYSLNLVNEIFEKDMPDCFIHNFRIVHDKDTKKVIEGLHFTFIELPKFTPHTFLEKRMSVLWLRFLTEIDSDTREVPADLLESPEISKALEEVKVSSFNDAELSTYDNLWDTISTAKASRKDKYEKGMEKGAIDEKIATAQRLLAMGLSVDQVATATQLTLEHIEKMKNSLNTK